MQLVKQKMAKYTNAEYANAHFTCGFCNGNALAAGWEYQLLYPERRQPDGRVTQAMHHNL
jgi:hypothetical protein